MKRTNIIIYRLEIVWIIVFILIELNASYFSLSQDTIGHISLIGIFILHGIRRKIEKDLPEEQRVKSLYKRTKDWIIKKYRSNE